MEISFNDVKKHPQPIIDIRENYLYNMNHLKNTKNIPWTFLLINPQDYLEKNKEYYLLCELGHKSKMISDILNREGYLTYSIIGGINNYFKK